MAVGIIRYAHTFTAQGNTITIRWVPSHRGVEGNGQASQRAVEAATLLLPRTAARRRSLACLKRRATEQATQTWRDDTIKRAAGRRPFVLPTTGSKLTIRPALRWALKSVAARFFQLPSGHSLIAPFLRDRWGWTDTDRCWWCSKGRQSREHLFKECTR